MRGVVTAGRRKHDFYPTPSWAADVLWARLPRAVDQRVDRTMGVTITMPRFMTWAEPCVGDGALARPSAPPPAWTNDVDPAREATFHFDAAIDSEWHERPPVDWVVSNPPFDKAAAILRGALGHARIGVAMLLRLSFLEPTHGRRSLLALTPPTRIVVLPRISFTGDRKTDSVTCAWMIWSAHVDSGIEVVSTAKEPA